MIINMKSRDKYGNKVSHILTTKFTQYYEERFFFKFYTQDGGNNFFLSF
jgi:hypothetical protein